MEHDQPSPQPNGAASGRPRGSRRRTAFRLAWMSLYALSVRVAILAVTALLFVYFGLNSPSLARRASAMISDLLPGAVAFKQLRWGPSPGHLEVIGLQIDDPSGHKVLGAQGVQVELQWWAAIERALAGKPGLELWLSEVRLSQPDVRIETDERGRLRLVEAFVDSEKPDGGGKGAPFSLRLDRAMVEHGSYRLDMPGVTIEVHDLDFDLTFHLRTAPDEAPTMSWEARDILAGRAAMVLPALDESGLAQFPAGSIGVRAAEGDLWSVKVRTLSADLGATKVHRGDVDVSWRDLTRVLARNLKFDTSTQDPFLASMLKPPLFNARASGTGRVSWQTGNRIDGKFETRGSGVASGFDLADFEGKVTVRMGHSDLVRIAVDSTDFVAHGYGGTLRAPKMDYRLRTDGLQLVQGRVQAEGISPAELLATDIVGMKGSVALALDGKLDGTVDTKVRLGMRPGATPGLDLDVQLDTDLKLMRADKALVLPKAVPQLFAHGGVKFVMGPDVPMSVDLTQFTLSTSQDADTTRPSRRPGSQWLFGDGRIELQGGGTRLTLEANVPDLSKLLAPLGVRDVGGSIVLRKVSVAGELMQPSLRGQVHLKNLGAMGYRVDDLRTEVRLDGGTIGLRELTAQTPYGRLQGDFTAGLFAGGLGKMARSQPVSGRKVRLSNLKLGPLLQRFGVRGYSGTAALSGASFDLDLKDALSTLQFQGQVALLQAQALHQRLRRAQAQVSVRAGAVKLRGLEVELPPRHDQIAVQAAGPIISGELDYHLADNRYRADLTCAAIDFSQIGDIARLNMPLRGSLAGSVKASGDLRDVALEADVAVAGLAWDQIAVGDARVKLSKARGKPLTMRSERFFAGFDLLEGSEVHFRRLMPERMRMGIRAHKLDPYAMMSIEHPSDMKVRIDASSWVTVDLRKGKELYNVAIRLPSGGALVELGHGLDPLSNTRDTAVDVHPDRVDIGSTYLAIGRDELELCGTLRYPDAARGLKTRLSLFAAGTLDVLRTGPLTESMAALDMRVDIGRDPEVAKDPAAACLRSVKLGRGALRIAGPLDDLAPQGVLQLQRSTLTPRGFGREIILAGGGQLVVGTNRQGRLVVTIPEDNPIDALLDDGRVRTWGKAQVAGNALETLDVRLTANDITYLQPKMMSLATSGGLRLVGTHLNRPRKRDVLLRGNVNITEAAYFANHDRFGKMVSGVAGRQAGGGSQGLLEKMPWLGPTRLDVEVRGRNVEVLSRLPLARTEVELRTDLRVHGTVADPKIDGRVDIEPGSIVTYTLVKRDFEVTRGSLDLGGDWREGFVDITARTVIEMDSGTDTTTTSTMGIGLGQRSGSSSLDNKVTITMQARGKLGADNLKEFDIRLSSSPPYEQGDIQAMILTGQPLTGNSGSALGSRSSINLLVDDVAEAFTKALFSGLLDKVEVAPTTTGGFIAKVRKNIGKAIELSGQYLSTAEGTETRAAFSFRFQDNWSMEGLLRQTLTTSSGVTAGNVYEGKVRYRKVLGD